MGLKKEVNASGLKTGWMRIKPNNKNIYGNLWNIILRRIRVRNCSVVSSLTSENWMTQAGLVYLVTGLARAGYDFQLLDLSGRISYFSSPEGLHSRCDSQLWMNPQAIKSGEWMDSYLPSVDKVSGIVFFSSLFSPDVVFHARYSYNIKTVSPKSVTIIGGAALAGLRSEQLDILRHFFDYILIGHDVEAFFKYQLKENIASLLEGVIIRELNPPQFKPDYSLVDIKEFITIYSGHGCYYGKCNFCDYPARAYQNVYFKDSNEIARELQDICKIQPNINDIVLTQDSYTKKELLKTANAISLHGGGHIPYNLMLRAEPWVNENIGKVLAQSGCTDVFIGAESLDDGILKILNKGITADNIVNSIKVLSEYVDITIGMILFIPGINEKSLDLQLQRIEDVLPYVYSIEPEVLTVMIGSGFAREASKYGIILNATKNLLNDSWCFGLSQDIPWAMSDTSLMKKWFEHVHNLRKLLSGKVKPEYWDAIECL